MHIIENKHSLLDRCLKKVDEKIRIGRTVHVTPLAVWQSQKNALKKRKFLFEITNDLNDFESFEIIMILFNKRKFSCFSHTQNTYYNS
jgi:hypothetical protein